MAIDDARHHELASRVDDSCACRSLKRWANLSDFAVLDKDRAVFNGAVRNGEDRRILNQNHGTGIRRRSARIRSRHKQGCKPCDDDNSKTNFHRASPCCMDEISASEESLVGLTPVKSIENSWTLMVPLMEVPSNVPLNVTSANDGPIEVLITKLNLSPLR